MISTARSRSSPLTLWRRKSDGSLLAHLPAYGECAGVPSRADVRNRPFRLYARVVSCGHGKSVGEQIGCAKNKNDLCRKCGAGDASNDCERCNGAVYAAEHPVAQIIRLRTFFKPASDGFRRMLVFNIGVCHDCVHILVIARTGRRRQARGLAGASQLQKKRFLASLHSTIASLSQPVQEGCETQKG